MQQPASSKPYWCLVMPPLVHPNSIQSNQKNNKDRNTVENTDTNTNMTTNTDTHKGHFGCAHISSIEPPEKKGMGWTSGQNLLYSSMQPRVDRKSLSLFVTASNPIV